MNDDQKQEEQLNTEETPAAEDVKEPQTEDNQPHPEDGQALPDATEDTSVNQEQPEDENTEGSKPAENEASIEKSEKESDDEAKSEDDQASDDHDQPEQPSDPDSIGTDTPDVPGAKWYVVHTYSGHENKVAAALKQRVESEHLENKIVDVLVPTQEKIEIRGGKKETIKEKIFPGYILVKMVLDDDSWLAVRTTQGVTSFIGMSNKPTPIPEVEVKTIVNFMQQGGQPTYKQIFSEGDTVKIIDGPFAEFIGKIDSIDKERGKVKVLVSIFGRETPVELDFLQVAKL